MFEKEEEYTSEFERCILRVTQSRVNRVRDTYVIRPPSTGLAERVNMLRRALIRYTITCNYVRPRVSRRRSFGHLLDTVTPRPQFNIVYVTCVYVGSGAPETHVNAVSARARAVSRPTRVFIDDDDFCFSRFVSLPRHVPLYVSYVRAVPGRWRDAYPTSRLQWTGTTFFIHGRDVRFVQRVRARAYDTSCGSAIVIYRLRGATTICLLYGFGGGLGRRFLVSFSPVPPRSPETCTSDLITCCSYSTLRATRHYLSTRDYLLLCRPLVRAPEPYIT